MDTQFSLINHRILNSSLDYSYKIVGFMTKMSDISNHNNLYFI
jgi:hypothetical protein